MMKKFLAMAMAAVLALSLVACGGAPAESAPASEAASKVEAIKAAGKLVLGTEAQYAPFEFIDMDGNFAGCDIWLANKIAEKLGVELEVMDMAFDGIIPAVKAGQVDLGIAAFTVDPERAKEIDFSKVYQKDAQMLLVKKGNEATYNTKEALKGLQLGAQRGTIQSKIVASVFPESPLFELDKWPALALEVINGNIAGIVVDGAVAEGLVANNEQLVIADYDFSGEDIDVGKAAVLQKGNDDLMAVVNEVMDEVIADGSFEAAYEDAVALSKTLGI